MTLRKKPEERLKMGRPTKYCAELANLICERVASHSCGLRAICKLYDDMPELPTIQQWRIKYPDFSARYMSAREQQSHILFESAIDDVEEIKDYVYVDEMTGAKSVNPGIVAMQKAIAFQKTHQAARIKPLDYGAQAEAARQNKNDETLQKVSEKMDFLIKDAMREY